MTAKPNSSTFQVPELLAPAGNWECAEAAVENGADAIYFGLDKFNARMRAENFTEVDLPELMEFLHLRGVKGYVTLNTLIFPQELRDAEQYIRSIISAGVDAVIVQDVGICRLIRHISPDFPIHASTQMTITSAVGVEFAKELGCNLVVLARECSLKEINKIQQQLSVENLSVENSHQRSLPLEVFVHGALCVAYSGQCLTSEALGGRSANRGECAQACRMPYELIVDGEVLHLGDRKYLLSPQDLAGLEVIPELVKSGVSCLKIEGRLKTPEYVANVTRVYRQALDKVTEDIPDVSENQQKALVKKGDRGDKERYNLEMAFSRGLYTGWFQGINNQELVHARFGKKRGVYLGKVTHVGREEITLRLEAPVKAGDGVVLDCGHPEMKEEGGRVYGVLHKGKDAILRFGKRDLNFRKVHIGDRIWKTSDPELDKQVRQSFTADKPQFQRPIFVELYGEVGENLIAIARDEVGHVVQTKSSMTLVEAHSKPLSTERLQEQFGRLGNTTFCLEKLKNHLKGELMLPVSELNKMRREIVARLEELRTQPKLWKINENASSEGLLAMKYSPSTVPPSPNLIVLVRNFEQLEATLTAGITTIYCEFEDPRKYKQAVELVRQTKNSSSSDNSPSAKIWVAPPRITKPAENWILEQVRSSNADGYLIRNYDHLRYFAGENCIGDFSLNVANALTADYFRNRFGLERLTASYDLNIYQLQDLLRSAPPEWFEVTIHQRMPMFHMEHCVFCAFLSEGIDFRDCGRPCEKYEVKIRDRVGTEHILQADAGCRNTVFNGTAQTGAEYVQNLVELGLENFRIEFVNETVQKVTETIHLYQQLLQGEITGSQLWRELRLQNQLGVTRGTVVS